jgi:hypothetical protein
VLLTYDKLVYVRVRSRDRACYCASACVFMNCCDHLLNMNGVVSHALELTMCSVITTHGKALGALFV